MDVTSGGQACVEFLEICGFWELFGAGWEGVEGVGYAGEAREGAGLGWGKTGIAFEKVEDGDGLGEVKGAEVVYVSVGPPPRYEEVCRCRKS